LAKTKIYSPNQVLAISFLGGPMAMIYALWKNFRDLEDPHGMRQILIWGSFFIIALMAFAPLMSTAWPDYVLPLAYPFAAWSLAKQYQMTKQAIAESQIYEFQTVPNVIVVSIIFLLVMMVTAVVVYSALAMIGWIQDDVAAGISS
jgi:uncharacterized Tic20 family protein